MTFVSPEPNAFADAGTADKKYAVTRNLGELLKSYDKVLVAEMNNGQMLTLLKSQYIIDAKGLLKVSGQPLKIEEVSSAIRSMLGSN